MGVAGYSGVMANFHPDMYAWLCDHYADADKQELVEDVMAYLGAASTIECQVYPINAKYHMNLVGVPMTLVSRTKNPELLTCGVPTRHDGNPFPSSKILEIDQFYAVEKIMRKVFFG